MPKYSKGDIVQFDYSCPMASGANANAEYEVLSVEYGGKKYRLVKRGSGSKNPIGPIDEKYLNSVN